MTQTFQQIGGVSPQLDAVAQEMQGWGGVPPLGAPGLAPSIEAPVPFASEFVADPDFSFRDRRANLQNLAWSAGIGSFNLPPPMAAHVEPSMAAVSPLPPTAAQP